MIPTARSQAPQRRRHVTVALLVLLCALLSPMPAAATVPTLPRPASLEPWVAFWTEIYGSRHDGVLTLHDSRDVGIVYGVLETPPGQSLESRRQRAEPEIEAFRKALRDVASGAPAATSAYHQRVISLWGPDLDPIALIDASENIRFQVGHATAFRDALVQSRRWRPWINRVLDTHQLPRALGAIPFVESFFRPEVAPDSGARGIWQFTMPAARRDMHVGDGIDERMSYYKSTLAAARLLAHNLNITRRWPLAVTAYNHGTAGVLRAVRQHKTRDLGHIARHFIDPDFGFASRNFYAQVLAAAHVESQQSRYFSDLPSPEDRPTRYALTLDLPSSLREISIAENISLKALTAANPDIIDTRYQSRSRLPAGFTVFVNCINDCPDPNATKANPDTDTPAPTVPQVTVAAGDTLGHIALRVGSSVAELARANQLDISKPLRIGRTLRVPGATAVSTYIQFPPELQLDSDYDNAPANPQHMPVLRPTLVENSEALTRALRETRPQLPDNPGTVKLPNAVQYALEGDTLTLLNGESTGLIALWLEIDTASLHRLNNLGKQAVLDIGHRLTLAFDHVTPVEFERRRLRHHRDKQYAWYQDWRIDGTLEYIIKPGDRLWRIADKQFNVPQWLLLEYNPDLDFTRVRAGSALILPRAIPRESTNRES